MRAMRNGFCLTTLLLSVCLIIGCSNPNVTMANYERIQNGMSKSEVIGIMGRPDDEDSGAGGVAGFAASGTKLRWGGGGKKIVVTFVDDAVFLKVGKGL